ncbi:DUF7221 family queuine tRNA-ribosyltransferase-like protein [Methylobacterium platani]|uniref:DeoxyPurine in DNA protein A domain-containing protein n=1 Tax=Methylobacterium platani TaxID=427683 RepID=A0A179SFF0_9HYPH|nr:hypothetical protein [Methylobacterium platani]OAS26315.1 hypothetical protein A5481_06265 [Methylobacterium platani]
MSADLAFYPGIHQPGNACTFQRAFISINRLRGRLKPITCPDVVIDSGAFTELERFGRYRHGVEEYARELRRLHAAGVVRITAAVAQDFMCESFMLARTGLTVAEHQSLTIERYDALMVERLPFPILPVLQGFAPQDYVAHLEAYGDRLEPGHWVGVGSVCKRNGRPEQVVAVLSAIKRRRPDLRLHGFGVKLTSLMHPGVREMLHSADSMAWSYSARKQGRNGNDPLEAKRFVERVMAAAGRAFEPWQIPLLSIGAAA